MWSAMHSYWLRSNTPRRCLAAGTALTALAPLCSLIGALVLSRVFRSSVAGWGDLIGAVFGVYMGFWVAASAVLVIASRLGARPWWVGVTAVAGLLPSTVLTIAIATNLGVPFPATILLLWVFVSVCATWAGSPRRRDGVVRCVVLSPGDEAERRP